MAAGIKASADGLYGTLQVNSADVVTFNDSGNVGIGTLAPSAKFESSTVTAGTNFKFSGNNFAGGNFFGTSVNATGVFLGLDSGGGFATNVRDAGYLTYSTNNTERMRITSAGNVGIGTSAPSTKLQVAGAVSIQGTAGFPSSGVGIELYYDTTNGSHLQSYDRTSSAWKTLNINSNLTTFATAGAERMRIDSSGNVGVGTTSPVAKLAVVGGTSNASSLATAYSLAAFNITPKSSSGYSLQFGSGPADLPYIQMSAGGAAAGDMTIQPYGGSVFVGTTTNIGTAAKVTIDAGTTNALTYTTLASRGGSRMYVQQQETTSVSTTAVVILTPSLFGSLCLIQGTSGANRFQDLVMFGLATATVNVISSLSISGSPAARTYSQTSSTYRVAMGSGTYTVQVAALSMSS